MGAPGGRTVTSTYTVGYPSPVKHNSYVETAFRLTDNLGRYNCGTEVKT